MGACVFSFFFPVAAALWSPDPSVHFRGEPLFSDQISCPQISVWFSFFIAQACEAQLRLCKPWLWVMSLNPWGTMTHAAEIQLNDVEDELYLFMNAEVIFFLNEGEEVDMENRN